MKLHHAGCIDDEHGRDRQQLRGLCPAAANVGCNLAVAAHALKAMPNAWVIGRGVGEQEVLQRVLIDARLQCARGIRTDRNDLIAQLAAGAFRSVAAR